MIDAARRLAILALALLLLGACGPSRATHQPPSPIASRIVGAASTPSPMPGPIPPNVRDASLLDATTGWVLTDDALLWTTDGGQRWKSIAPPALALSAIHSVYFYDRTDGWLVASDTSHRGTVLAYATRDAGATWHAALLAAAPPNGEPFGRAEFSFIDRYRGWINLDNGSHAGFSYGRLFKTTDGGATWSFVSNDQFGPLHFNSELDGWLASYDLLVTHDGGATWSKAALPPPLDASRRVDLNALTTERNTDLVTDNSRGNVAFLAPDQGMRLWHTVGTLSRPGSQGPGTVAIDLLDASTWAVYVYDRDRGASIAWTRDAGRTWRRTVPAGLASTITKLSFATPHDGWSLVVISGCRAFKSNCYSGTELFGTADGGSTWHRLPL
ncbi:MAG: WD40/YVTN/BNR-like repeat-containing protein [Dehalococcoidia bacterium]